jgi:hypothetical protein
MGLRANQSRIRHFNTSRFRFCPQKRYVAAYLIGMICTQSQAFYVLILKTGLFLTCSI